MKFVLIATAAFILAAPLAAQAGHGHGGGNGHGDGDASAHANDDGDRREDSDHAHWRSQPGWTPPGLAKKPYGMPPGQAKKMWRQGDRLPPTYITERYYVADPSRYNLAPTPYGYRWVRVGNEYYLAQTQTGLVSQVISALIH